VRVHEPGEDERIGDRDDGRSGRVWTVTGDTADGVSVNHQLPVEHAAVDRDNRPVVRQNLNGAHSTASAM
jgi:hypothetical protein